MLWYDDMITIPNYTLKIFEINMQPNPLSFSRLYEQMAESIRQQIVDGKLKTGDRLPNERDLAKQFDVSRTVVREAIKSLKQEGLVEVRPGLGTFVVDATGEALTQSFGLMMSLGNQNKLSDIVEIREILEPEIAAMAALRAAQEDIARMEKAMKLMDQNIEDIDEYTEEDHSFHLALARATQNIIIPRLIASIVDLLQELRQRIALVDGARERGQMHHRNIVESIRNQDPQAARAAMQAHLQQVREDSGADTDDKEKPTND